MVAMTGQLVYVVKLGKVGTCAAATGVNLHVRFFFGCSGMCKFTPVACGISAANTILLFIYSILENNGNS